MIISSGSSLKLQLLEVKTTLMSLWFQASHLILRFISSFYIQDLKEKYKLNNYIIDILDSIPKFFFSMLTSMELLMELSSMKVKTQDLHS